MTAVAPRIPRGAALARRATSAATSAAIAALAAFHAWLLVTHIVGGRLFEPAVALRWFSGALILAGFMALRRVGAPLLFGRRAVVLWLFVVLLHWNAIVSPAAPVPEMAATIPEAVTALVGPSVIGPLLAALGLFLAAFAGRRPQARPRALALWPRSPVQWGAPHASFIPQFSVRPPPL